MFTNMMIYEDRLINNIKQVKQKNPNAKVCAMVKANAYGLGVNYIVKVLNNYVDYFGVACFFEAKLIKSLTNKQIIILGPLDCCDDFSFSYSCFSVKDVIFLANKNVKINVHLGINTGMNRYGFNSLKEFNKALSIIKTSKLNLEGVFTHFATNDDFVEVQYNRFNRYVKLCVNKGFNPIVHCDNSAVSMSRCHNQDMVRVGYNLFISDQHNLMPVVEISTKVVQINKIHKGDLVGYSKKFIARKSMMVAVLPVGYADGFSCLYIGKKIVIKGKLCNIINVCMDCLMIDVSHVALKKGEVVYLVNQLNPLKDYAKYIGMSVYEVLTNFSSLRANRILVPFSNR